MRTTSPEATESVSPPGLQRLFRFGTWCFIVVGVSHLVLTGIAALGAPDPATQRALDAMRAVPTTLPGIRSDMAQLYYGFGVSMALLGIGVGLLNLLVLRLAPGILVRGTALLWLDAAVSALLLAVAVLAFPAPPIVATAAALAAYGWALAMTRRVPHEQRRRRLRGVNMALPGSRLDPLLPRYDFTKRHARVIGREPRAVYDAFKALTLRETPVSRLLFAVRSLPARLAGRRGLPSQSGVPLLDQFLDSGFVLLVDVPGEELAAGEISQMWRRGGRMVIPSGREEFVAFAEPGFVKAALTFRFIGRGDGTTLVETETRVAATDPTARRGFGRYWLLIRGFSGLIRRDWLWAVARRAERS